MKQETAREPLSGDRGISVLRLPFSEIPHQSRLFVEYLHDPLSLTKYYPNAASQPSEAIGFAPKALEGYKVDRDRLCDALTQINISVGAKAPTFANIERLREPNTVAVLTGQQAGLFSGPLYTIYKALSAVKLAEDLNEKGCSAVPIFWAATEDHDFDEVGEVHLTDGADHNFRIGYRPAELIDGISVGAVQLDATIGSVIDCLIGQLSQTSFSGDVRKLLDETWTPSAGFGDAFGRTIQTILARFGIIYVDPRHPEIKQLALPVYRAAADKAAESVPALIERGKQLEADGFHQQVLMEDTYFPLFWHDNHGLRLSLRRQANDLFRAKGTRTEFSLGQILEQIDRAPERFSPGVMLRPVVQDYLFPTVCSFGGGAEIAYFAQNSEVYRILERPVTPIFHRQSFTIVEPAQRRALKAFGLEISDLFDGKEALKFRLAGVALPEMVELLADVEKEVGIELDRLDGAIRGIDATLVVTLEKRRRKMLYHIAALKRKTLLAAIRKDAEASRRLDALFEHLLPAGGLQERTLNVLYFLNKYGPNFIDWIYDSIDLKDKDHRVVEL